jgi:hypothetical protein
MLGDVFTPRLLGENAGLNLVDRGVNVGPEWSEIKFV